MKKSKKLFIITYNCASWTSDNKSDINTWTEENIQFAYIRRKACINSLYDMIEEKRRAYKPDTIVENDYNYSFMFTVIKDGKIKYYHYSITYMCRP